MLKKYSFLLLLITIVFTNSCGYAIRGLSKDGVQSSFFVESVWNKTTQANFTPLIQTEVENYLIDYAELARESYAKYTLQIIVDDIDNTPLITSQYDESTVTNSQITLTFVVTTRAGREIYTGNFSASRSYSVSAEPSDILKGRDDAIVESIKSIMADFRNNFYEVDR